jgi:hypothetical protein
VEQKVIQLPRNAPFDSLQASSHLIAMRKDRGSVDTEFTTNHWSWEPDEATKRVDCAKCGDMGINLGRLRYNSNLMNVTRKPRYVLSIRFVDDEVAEGFAVIVSPIDRAGKISWGKPESRLDLLQMATSPQTVSFAQLLKQLR